MHVYTLNGEPVSLREYLRRLRDGSEPRSTPESEAEAWARRHAPPGAPEDAIADLAAERLPHQVRVAKMASAFADSFRRRGPRGVLAGMDHEEVVT